jgi:hypothetical protein
VYGVADYGDDFPIVCQDVKIKIPKKQFGSGTKNGLSEMYHFYCHPDAPGQAAVRRIPCCCDPCYQKIMIPWDSSKTFEEQEKFEIPPDCQFQPSMGELNKWVFVTFELATKSDKAKKQVNRVYQMVLDQYVERARKVIEIDKFGAIACGNDEVDGFWLVQWKSNPFQLAKDHPVEGSDGKPIPKDSWCCEGLYWYRVSHAPGWYEWQSGSKMVFWLQHCLDGDVDMLTYSSESRVPNGAKLQYDSKAAKRFVKIIPDETIDSIKRTKKRLDFFTPFELTNEVEEEEKMEEKEEEEKTEEQERTEFFRDMGFLEYLTDSEAENDSDEEVEEEEEEEEEDEPEEEEVECADD